jgi:peptide chain release factor 1
MNLRPHIEKFARRLEEVQAALSDPKLFENPMRYQEMSREYSRLKEQTDVGERYLKTVDDLAQHAELLKTEPADSELAQLAREEIAVLQAGELKLGKQVQMGLAPPDPADSRNTIIEIRAGAGGSEERRVGKECLAVCRSRWSPYH